MRHPSRNKTVIELRNRLTSTALHTLFERWIYRKEQPGVSLFRNRSQLLYNRNSPIFIPMELSKPTKISIKGARFHCFRHDVQSCSMKDEKQLRNKLSVKRIVKNQRIYVKQFDQKQRNHWSGTIAKTIYDTIIYKEKRDRSIKKITREWWAKIE